MLTEILRRLVQITLWFVAGSASLLILANLFIDTFGGKDNLELPIILSAVLILVGAYVCHRILNWISVKDEKMLHQSNLVGLESSRLQEIPVYPRNPAPQR